LQGIFFKNKEILNGWKEIMFFENGSTVKDVPVIFTYCQNGGETDGVGFYYLAVLFRDWWR
jgi:hypothetical protein